MDKTFHITTFGCQMNVHDSQRMAELLKKDGWRELGEQDDARLIVFNTCSVRDHARHKAISEAGKALHRKKQNREIIVGITGCVAQAEQKALFRTYPHLDFVLGPDQIGQIASVVASVSNDHAKRVVKSELVNDADAYVWTRLDARETAAKSPVSAFVTIVKGCNNKCTYCIVPSVRGSEVSRPANEIVEDVRSLVDAGVKEVVLLGQNVNSYKMNNKAAGRLRTKTSDFVELVRRISAETDILRIRYMSPHPKDLGLDLMEEHATNPKLCSHMHLPLQSGSSKVLRDMKRSYNKDQFLSLTTKLRELVKAIDITTDFIVGFPGETDEDFNDTLDVVKHVLFDGMFAFKYSPREGTQAAAMIDDVPMEVKDARLQQLLDLNAKIWAEKTNAMIGTMQSVLVEGESKRTNSVIPAVVSGKLQQPLDPRLRGDDICGYEVQLTGHNFGNKIVNLTGNLNLVGHIVSVKIVRAGANSLTGELI